MSSTSALNLIDHWLRYIDCAVTHCPVPPGQHAYQQARGHTVPEVAPIYEALYKLYTEVPVSDPFREPVNALQFNAFDYYRTISIPMSIRTVLDRLSHRYYSNASQVFRDVQLIWSNCELFNGSQSILSQQARECGRIFLELVEGQKKMTLASSEEVDKLLESIETLESEDGALVEEILDFSTTSAPHLLVTDEASGSPTLAGEKMTERDLEQIQKIVERYAQQAASRKRPRASGTTANW